MARKKIEMVLLPDELWFFRESDYKRDICKLQISNLKSNQEKHLLEKQISELKYQVAGLQVLQKLETLNKQKEQYFERKQNICDRLKLKTSNFRFDTETGDVEPSE